MRTIRRFGIGVAVASLAVIGIVNASSAPPAHAASRVLLVGTYDGIKGQYSSLQAAVNAAHPGDWILVAPGDYKTSSSSAPKGASDTPAGVLVQTPDLWIRGMNRNQVVIDGTKPGTPQCSNKTSAQNGALNGIMVWKADNVWVQNLTVCNFLAGAGQTGNEIWWNGGANSSKIGGWGYGGTYLNATSTYFGSESTAAQYGLFSSDWSGGTWDQTYASNFNDSGFYIGACQQVCDQTVDHAWAEYNALGYSGSNSGGQLLVENSQFDHNEDGFDTNSQNGDNPPPQNGDCPGGGISSITRTRSCWVFVDNYVHDNNNADVPSAGSAAAGPVGTGMSLSGARNDTVMDNVFANNGAWGTILVPYPDSGPPCSGGTDLPGLCLFDEYGDAVTGNTYSHNGFFKNPTNGDIGAVNLELSPPSCFRGNHEVGGGPVSTSPPLLQTLFPSCRGLPLPDLNALFLAEVACDAQSISIGPIPASAACLPGTHYPRRTQVVMHPLPTGLPTMPDPCVGVPSNPWCPAAKH